MDVRDRFEAHARSVPTPRPDDPAVVFGRGRRRRTRRRVSAGATGALVTVLAIAVAWPGAGLPGPIVDEVAGGEVDADGVLVLDLPDGWQQVQVGDAVFGLPPHLEVEEADADDPEPCSNSGPRAVLAPESFPAATEDADGVMFACNLLGSNQPFVLSSRLSVVPDQHLDPSGFDGAPDATWVDVDDAPVAGEVRVTAPPGFADEPDDGVAARTATYRFPTIDLFLRFTTNRADTAMIDAIVATITPIDPDRTTANAADVDDRDVSDDGAVSFTTTSPLAGVWELVGHLDDDLPEPLPPLAPRDEDDDLPTLRVSADGGLHAELGCNWFSGVARVVRGQMEVWSTMTTSAGCGGERVRDLERQQGAIATVLTGRPEVAVDGDTLSLGIVDGDGLVYRRIGASSADPGRSLWAGPSEGVAGAAGTRTTTTHPTGVDTHLYTIEDLDLHLRVHGPDLTPGLVDDLLAAITPAP